MPRPAIGPFLVVIGALMIIWGITGWFTPADVGDTATNIFYLIAGVIISWSGWMWAPGVRHDWTTNIGLFFVILAILGFLVSSRDAPNLWIVNMHNPVDNIVNLISGIVLILGGRRILTEDVFLPPRSHRRVG